MQRRNAAATRPGTHLHGGGAATRRSGARTKEGESRPFLAFCRRRCFACADLRDVTFRRCDRRGMRATALHKLRSCGRNLHGGRGVSACVHSGRSGGSCRRSTGRRRGMPRWQLPGRGVCACVEVVRPAVRVVEGLPSGATTLVRAARGASRPVLRCVRSAPVRALCAERRVSACAYAKAAAPTPRLLSLAPPPSRPLPPLPPPPSSCASWPPTRAPRAPPRHSWARSTRSARPAKKPRWATWPPNQPSRSGSARPDAPPCRRCCSRGWTSLRCEAHSKHASAPSAPRRQHGCASACVDSAAPHAPAGRRSL